MSSDDKKHKILSVAPLDELATIPGGRLEQFLVCLGESESAKTIDVSQASSQSELPDQDQDPIRMLLSCSEPERTRRLLLMYYEVSPEGVVLQDELWQLYEKMFAGHCGIGPPKLPIKDLMANVFGAFPKAMPSTESRGNPMLRGISRRASSKTLAGPPASSRTAVAQDGLLEDSLDARSITKSGLLSRYTALVEKGLTETDALFKKLQNDDTWADSASFQHVLLSFLQDVVPLMKKNAIPLDSAGYRNLFRNILNPYILHVVGQEPLSASGMAHRKQGYGCADSRQLDFFLVSPDPQIGCFSMNKERREHLSERLSYRQDHGTADLDYTVDTERPEHREMYQCFTLVVTKKVRSIGEARTEWTRRCKEAKQFLRKLATASELGKLLGEDNKPGQYEVYDRKDPSGLSIDTK